jgi:hypothetical protein
LLDWEQPRRLSINSRRRSGQSLFFPKLGALKQEAAKLKILSSIVLALTLIVNVLPAAAASNSIHTNIQARLQTTSTRTFLTNADAYVKESNPNTNYGTGSSLQVDGASDPDIESFIRFAIVDISGAIQDARLRVYSTSDGTKNGPAVYGVDTNWTETGITWNNRPVRTSESFDNKSAISKSTWVEYNITALVTGNGIVSFALVADSTDSVRFSSRQGNRPPELVLTISSPVDTPTSTSTPTNTLAPPTPTDTPEPGTPPIDTPTPTDTPSPGTPPIETSAPTNTIAPPTPTPSFTPTNTPQPDTTPITTPTAPASGDPLFVSFGLGGTVSSISFANDDILRFDGQNWSLYFDGSDVGAGSVDLMDFFVIDSRTILMAFSANLSLNNGTLAVTPQDVVQFNATSLGPTTAGGFNIYFNGADVGLADTTAEKIDGLSRLSDGRILISTTGNPSVAGVVGNDEDILAFTPSTLGDNTSGTWSLYFDGSDVGLAEASDEDINALDVVSGDVYLSTVGAFSVNGVTGAGEDVFICAPISLGDATSCNYYSSLFFDGSLWGLAGNTLDGVYIGKADSSPAATPTNIPTSTPTPSSTPTGSVVLVGAGDIAYCSGNNDEATAGLLDTISGTVFTLGDNAYESGTYTEYTDCYHPTWGRHKARTKPSPGNHEYKTPDAAGYFQYFDNIAPYYAYTLGAWRIYSLDSEIDVSASSPQVAWLQSDLAANPSQCVLAYWHTPRWSSGSTHGNSSSMQTLWQILYNAGAELVINGHEHNYERFAAMDVSGLPVPQGLREFVVGTGGIGHYGFGAALPASEVRDSTSFGVLKLTLRVDGYDWQFVPVAGSIFTDSGSGTCH